MSASEAMADGVAERWLALALESYPVAARASLAGNDDPFLNPAGRALRENLRVLARELLGSMDRGALNTALDEVVRLRAVQGFSPSEALRFVFALRQAAAEVSAANCASLQSRIDELALLAFDQYMSCREQIFALRVKERRSQARNAAQAE